MEYQAQYVLVNVATGSVRWYESHKTAIADHALYGGIVINTPDRAQLKAVQTPQVFDLDLLKGALARAEKNGDQVTDDCSAVERLGMKVRLVEGDERNMKVTTPLDLKIAQLLLEEGL